MKFRMVVQYMTCQWGIERQKELDLCEHELPRSCSKGSECKFQPCDPACEKKQEIEDVCKCLILSDEQIHKSCDALLDQLNKGLSKCSNADASVKCFPTFVRELPNGKETGKFLALDLGGTNFRVLLIELGPNKFSMESKIFAVPQKVMLGSGDGLFDHIVDCLSLFTKEHGVAGLKLPLGFTFSFPCSQEGLTKARLVTWTKGFNCSGVEGEDVVRLLRAAISRRGDVDLDVLAVLNDTTGCLMSCAWKNPTAEVGVIVGTGTNACYMEKLECVERYPDEERDDGPPQVIVNTEWGAFGDHGELDFVRTKYDQNIDEQSINPGRQLYEKMISGMYMGEVARQVLVDLTHAGLLFGGQTSAPLEEKGRFYTKYISEIEGERRGETTHCRSILEEELGIDNVTDEDCENVRYVCEVVSRRAAHLVSAGIATLLNKIQKKKVTVAVDGSVYRFHPHFHNLMMEKIKQLLKPGLEFDLMLSEDGSGRGAALVAAVASRIQLQKLNAASSC
jgi:hexokinase